MISSNQKSSKKLISFLLNDLGLEQSTIELGLKLSNRDNTPLPVLLWSYGILSIEELDRLYSFLFQNIE